MATVTDRRGSGGIAAVLRLQLAIIVYNIGQCGKDRMRIGAGPQTWPHASKNRPQP
jgi:hypothetical protein